MLWMCIKPVLKRIVKRDHWKTGDNVFDLHSPCACGVGGIIKYVEMRAAKKLHCRARHFAEFQRRMTQKHQRFVGGSHAVKRMPRFVQKGFNIGMNSRGVGENEWLSRFLKPGLKAG